MGLSAYQQKRRFNVTPEPRGRVTKKHKKLAFVIHKHRASHLHYDLRLEMGGVLKSWAVPKGPSLDTHVKRLAMMVEDHPFDYRKFEGTIPSGNYGAGKVIVWDNGTYEPRQASDDPEKSLLADLAKGHLTFILHGKKLKGEFALVKNHSAADNAWLLVKKADQYASSEDVTIQDNSVASSRRLADTATKENSVDVSRLPKKARPKKITPMLATLADQPFDSNDWLYEVKWDGYRALLYKEGSKLELRSRSGQDFNQKYSDIVSAAKQINTDFVIDGEIVAVDSEGKSHFEWLQNWQRAPEGNLAYMVFDILWLNGHDLTKLELINRKVVLKEILPASGVIKYSDYVIGQGKELFKLAKSEGLEGIMAKRCRSNYLAGKRSPSWLKFKTHLRQEVVIGGYTEPKGSRKYIGALVVGVYDKDELRYVGHTGGGIPNKLLPELKSSLDKITIKESPFSDKIRPNAPVHWVKPKLVCEVSFGEWTSGGQMRQPIFVGLREDKPANKVKRELLKVTKSEALAQTAKVSFSHQDKLFWPKRHYTKGDLIAYYQSVAEIMLPYIIDRPHSLLRQPNGVNGQAFFQKDVEGSVPDWIKKMTIYSESNKKDIHYLVCDSVDSLLYMVQLGCIEINPWNSRLASIDKPDWAVIDLDPEAIGFESVVKVALAVKQVCDQYEMPSFPKTSGKTGIHVYIPLGAQYSYDQTRQFGQLLANLIHPLVTKITSLERSPAKRQQKVYLDYLQNRKGQTLAAPYCVRPTPDASVSTPLKWSEVNSKLDPTKFTIKNTLKRIDKVGDLWQPVLGSGIDLKATLERIS